MIAFKGLEKSKLISQYLPKILQKYYQLVKSQETVFRSQTLYLGGVVKTVKLISSEFIFITSTSRKLKSEPSRKFNSTPAMWNGRCYLKWDA